MRGFAIVSGKLAFLEKDQIPDMGNRGLDVVLLDHIFGHTAPIKPVQTLNFPGNVRW